MSRHRSMLPPPVPTRARRRARRHTPLGLLVGAVLATALGVLAGAGVWSGMHWASGAESPSPWTWLDGADTVIGHRLTALVDGEPPRLEASRGPRPAVLYLNREGATLLAGGEDSSRNRSSVVAAAGLERFDVPPFAASTARWRGIAACVADRLEPYAIEVVDRRPMDKDYVMAVVGGHAGALAAAAPKPATGAHVDGHAHADGRVHDHEHHDGCSHGGAGVAAARRKGTIRGLAPMPADGSPALRSAVVYAFAEAMHQRTRDTCETIVHEVGHAFGLDHVTACKDPMSYGTGCGRKRFQDEAMACGEADARRCKDGRPTQNSHEALMRLVGPRSGPELAGR